jgi:hypothetical protein
MEFSQLLINKNLRPTKTQLFGAFLFFFVCGAFSLYQCMSILILTSTGSIINGEVISRSQGSSVGSITVQYKIDKDVRRKSISLFQGNFIQKGDQIELYINSTSSKVFPKKQVLSHVLMWFTIFLATWYIAFLGIKNSRKILEEPNLLTNTF